MIVAVDFDGVLCEDRFPGIGRPNYEAVSAVRQMIDAGFEVILWTSRAGDRLTEAVEWCEDYGLHFCAVNENAPSNRERYAAEYPEPSPKVYADVYLDDHCLHWGYMERHRREYGTGASPDRVMVEEIHRMIKTERGYDGER